jgi:hypothetical protein
MTRTDDLPDLLAHLPDAAAVRHLTPGVLRGEEIPPPRAVDAAATPLSAEERWRTASVRELVDEAMRRCADTPTSADAWMAPRLHATLRMTRAEAADSHLWNHLALRVAPDYVVWRHWPTRRPKEGPPAVNRSAFVGPAHKQAFSRLWWAAEQFRDGKNYGPVEVGCGNQDVLNSVLRFEVIRHRPTMLAFLRLLEDGTIHTGREVNGCIKAINTAGSTLLYEVMAPDDPRSDEALREWIDEAGEFPVPYDRLPEGPDDGEAPEKSVDVLYDLFADLYRDAPIRGREKSEVEPVEPAS